MASLPSSGLNRQLVMEVIGRRNFAVVYDIGRRITLIGIERKGEADICAALADAMPGLSLAKTDEGPGGTARVYCCYRQLLEGSTPVFGDVFSVGLKGGFVGAVFIPVGAGELERSKRSIEQLLSSRGVKETTTGTNGIFSSRTSRSVHKNLFRDSEEGMLLEQMLESINSSMLSNGMAYKVFVVADPDADVGEYLSSRVLVLREYGRVRQTDFGSLVGDLEGMAALPVGAPNASAFVNAYGRYMLSYPVRTQVPMAAGDIEVGRFLKDGVSDVGDRICIERSTLNLGLAITGLPGSGKTREAMSIVSSIREQTPEAGRTAVMVISPTSEWNDFADCQGMYKVIVGDGRVPINFFACPKGTERRVFYENLAMILSSASNAGPYRNPMEKCMLNAFRSAYADTGSPDPVEAYEGIEESIVKLHARRTAAGVKYTKHGENIRSALENLRAILSMPEYSVRDGAGIDGLAREGVVFDLSGVSSGSKAYMYALILNQIYAMASRLDLSGDGELRVLVCVEEAQLIFGDGDSAALQDIRQKIQDFRKQGVGIMLLTHNVTDIDPSLRRLCQTKIYLRQAPDTAMVAVRDMVFTYAEEEDVVLKLKQLASGTGALNYVTRSGAQKIPNDTIFIATRGYENPGKASPQDMEGYLRGAGLEVPKPIDAELTLECYSEEDAKTLQGIAGLRLLYLNEAVVECGMGSGGLRLPKLLSGRGYVLQLLGNKGRIALQQRITAMPEIRLRIEGGRLSQLVGGAG